MTGTAASSRRTRASSTEAVIEAVDRVRRAEADAWRDAVSALLKVARPRGAKAAVLGVYDENAGRWSRVAAFPADTAPIDVVLDRRLVATSEGIPFTIGEDDMRPAGRFWAIPSASRYVFVVTGRSVATRLDGLTQLALRHVVDDHRHRHREQTRLTLTELQGWVATQLSSPTIGELQDVFDGAMHQIAAGFAVDDAQLVIAVGTGKPLYAGVKSVVAAPEGDWAMAAEATRRTIAATAQPFVVNDGDSAPASLSSLMQSRGAQAMIVVPLWVDDCPVGWMGLFSSRARPWTAEEIHTLTRLSELVTSSYAQATSVAARIRAEAKYRALNALTNDAEARLQRAVEATEDGLWDWDIGRGRMWWSPRTAVLLDAPPNSERVRRTFVSRIHPDDRSKVARAVLAHLRSGAQFDQQMRILGRRGDLRWARLRGRVVERNGRRRFMAGSLRDITQEKQLEERNRQSQRLESLGLLAGGIAHDFNNLLMAIINFGRFARDDLAANPEEAQSSLREVLGAAERAAALTRRLLAFGRRQEVQRRSLELDSVVSGLATMLRRLIPENIGLDVAAGRATGSVLADPGQLEQVLINLCLNARDAMPEGGRIVISTEIILLDTRTLVGFPWASPGPFVRLKVSDTGTGMRPEVQQRAFEPFFTTKPEGEGTGLGLSTVYGIAKQNDGFVTIQSEWGSGTTVSFCLPQVEAWAASSALLPVEAVDGGHECILVAEDDAMARKVLQKLLLRAGYDVVVALDGEHALQRFRQAPERFDLVFADAIMPGLGGRQLFERVRAIRPRIPFLFGSGYGAGEFEDGFFAASDRALVAKPYDVDALLVKIRQLLGRVAS